MPHASDREAALAGTVRHFQQEQAPIVVSWCPSCHHNLRNGSDPAAWAFEELHITEFIARHLHRLSLYPRISARVLLHGHCGTADRDRDMDCCRRLLQAIPGITLVGEHSDPELGLQCVPDLIAAKIGREHCERKLRSIVDQACGSGAETVVTVYHSCYRELEKRLAPGSLTVENYITLLAKSMDVAVPANIYREVAHGGQAQLVQIACAADSRSIARHELDRALHAEFPFLYSEK